MEQEFQFFFSSETEQDEDQELNLDLNEERTLRVRLDKWLWAARFFKTRAIARAAVEKGKVFYNGERSKPNREIEIGAILSIRLGSIEKIVAIKGLSTRRRSTEEALQLFEETEESRLNREQHWNGANQAPKSFSPRFIQHPFDPTTQATELTQEKRTVRFLRRSFVRGEPKQQKGTHSRLRSLEVDLTD